MNNKILRFYSGGSDLDVEYAKSILPLMGNIREFEVFRSKEDSPYVSKGDNNKYTFVLKDDKDNELWLSNSLCGYGGAGPSATKRILKLFGLLEDYEITEKQHVKERNLNPIHRLNILVSTPLKYGLENKHHFWVSTKFQYAYQLLRAKEALACFGTLCSAKQQGIDIPYSLRKQDVGEEWADYAINNEYIFHMQYREFDTSLLTNIVLDVIVENQGEFEIIEL